MADGSIKIQISVDGKQVELASKDLDNLAKSGQTSGKGVKEAEDGLKGVGKESEKASGSVKKFATALGLVAVAAAAFAVLKSSLDDAISRFDTLNKFPKVLRELGVSAEDAESSIQRLSDGTEGLPTKLDEIASIAQRMYSSFSDMDLATESAIALNNALLGSGSSAEQASRGTEMYLKALQTGQIDMQTWRSMSETMDVGLIKIGESFGYAADTAKNELYQALKSGEITMTDFNEKLIEVGTGTGVMAKLAKENSLGLATSLSNLKTAVSRNLANIIQSFDKLSKEVTGKNIAQNIDSMKNVINAAFKSIQSVIEGSTPYVKAFGRVVKELIPVVKFLSPAIIGLMSAYAMHNVIHATTAALKTNTAVMAIVTTSKKILTLATDRMALSMALAQAKISLVGIATLAYNKIIAIAVATQALMTTGMSLASVGAVALSASIHVLNAAIKVLMGPIGWVTGAIGLLVAGAVALVKWFNKSTSAGKELAKESNKLAESSEKLADSSNQNVDAFKDQQDEMKKTGKEHKELIRQVEELGRKEEKSASDKHKLASYVDMLNESVEGLNLSYNEQTDNLNMTSEEMKEYVDLLAAQASYTDALERQVEITAEQQEIGLKLGEVNELRAEANELYNTGEIKTREYKDTISELDEAEEELKTTNAELGEQYSLTNEIIDTSIQTITEATKNGVAEQKIAFEDLSESQQKLVEDLKTSWESYYDAATDMFDRLSDESELTVGEMQENLEENQRIIGEWAEGIASLAERGVDEGLLDTLREAGPESAGHVAALVSASDEELEKLSGVFSEGGDVATKALNDSLDLKKSGIHDAIGHLVTGAEKTMKEQIGEGGFVELGVDVAEGHATGIEKGTPEAESAAKDMGQAVEDAARQQLETNSPSKVFERIGKDSADGMTLGISNGTVTVINATKALAVNMIKQFVNMRSNFIGIGSNAMAGLNVGLNAGSGRVMSTARRIANNVAATMKRALAIRSPSRLFRDEIGAMIPAGITVGIEDNADSVFKSIKAMGTTMIDVAKPEVALGAFADAGLRGNDTTNIINNTTNNGNNEGGGKYTIELVTTLDGSVIAREIVDDVTRIQNTKKYNNKKGKRR